MTCGTAELDLTNSIDQNTGDGSHKKMVEPPPNHFIKREQNGKRESPFHIVSCHYMIRKEETYEYTNIHLWKAIS